MQAKQLLGAGEMTINSVVKSTCFSRGPQFSSCHLHGGSQPSVPGDPAPSDAHTNMQAKYSHIKMKIKKATYIKINLKDKKRYKIA